MTTRTAPTTAALVAAAAILSAATLGLAIAPATGASTAPARAVFDLPPMHIAAQRTPVHMAVIDLPRVVVTGRRMAVVDLPTVVVSARRTPDAAAVVVAGR